RYTPDKEIVGRHAETFACRTDTEPACPTGSGIRLDLTGLMHSPGALVRVPVFLVALLIVRGVPAVLSLRELGVRATVAVGLLQATSLPFLVTATQIGLVLGKISSVTAAAIVCAGLLSVLVFPPAALALLGQGHGADEPPSGRADLQDRKALNS
ncbi:MAG: hypothetical protein ABJB98_04895, partial [Actinomycetota bacterium]